MWDDFEAYWHGLVAGILEATEKMPPGKLVAHRTAALAIPDSGYPENL